MLFRNAVLSNYVLPGLLLALCTFGGVVTALGSKRKRVTAVITGAFFVVAGLYLGDRYTATPFLFFGLTVIVGLAVSFGRSPAPIQHASRVRRLERKSRHHS